MRYLIPTVALAFVAACGGGSGSVTGPNSNVTANAPAQAANFTGGGGVMTAVVDANAAGAAVASGASGRLTMVALAEDLSAAIADFSASDIDGFSPNLPTISSTGGFTVKQGTGSWLDNDNVTLGTITIDGQDGYMLYAIDGANKLNVAVFAPEISSMPTSGQYTYTGTHFASPRTVTMNNSNVPTNTAQGTFSMSVDFGTGTGTITTSSTNITNTNTGMELSGNIAIDTVNGTFTGDNLTLNGTLVSLGSDTTAKIIGNFHQAGAQTVTGLYYQDKAEPDVGGAIIGKR